jgi:hypothetical protein
LNVLNVARATQAGEVAVVAVRAALAMLLAQHARPSTRWFTATRKLNLHLILAGLENYPNSRIYLPIRKQQPEFSLAL